MKLIKKARVDIIIGFTTSLIQLDIPLLDYIMPNSRINFFFWFKTQNKALSYIFMRKI
ncbi:hypothetical protein [Mammaliicoccus lentus]|uniref:hypothetical protein n=1 Tax=Mammaliicoccus lentus TaxID=42858 RepID=UPI00264A4C96|nr:hypothetical protein [Mammaliicoccus lentus]